MQFLAITFLFLAPMVWAGVVTQYPCGDHLPPDEFVQIRVTPDCQGDDCTAPVGALKTVEADFSLRLATNGVRYRVDRGFDLVSEGTIDFNLVPGQFYTFIFYYNPPLDHVGPGTGRYYITLYDRNNEDNNWVCSRIHMNVTSPV